MDTILKCIVDETNVENYSSFLEMLKFVISNLNILDTKQKIFFMNFLFAFPLMVEQGDLII